MPTCHHLRGLGRSRTELQRLEPISDLVPFVKIEPVPTLRGRCNKYASPGYFPKVMVGIYPPRTDVDILNVGR